MSKSLIIFDMDGTLIDSSRLLANAINYVREHLDLPPMPHEDIIGQVNNHQISPAKYFYEVDHFEPIHESWFSEYYTAHHDSELQLYDGIYDLLKWLKEQRVHIALATNAHRGSALESIRHLRIEKYFDTIMTAEDVAHPKPSPDMLMAILEVLGIPCEDAIFIGDGPRDEEAAQAAKMDYMMVDWGFTDHGKKNVVKSVDELKNILDRIVER